MYYCQECDSNRTLLVTQLNKNGEWPDGYVLICHECGHSEYIRREDIKNIKASKKERAILSDTNHDEV